MIDWISMVAGGLAMAALALGWLLWQRLAGRLDEGMRGRAPAGKCSLPDDLDAYARGRSAGGRGGASR